MSSNRHNSKIEKQLQTSMEEVTVSPPRNRNLIFDPQFINKRENILEAGIADRIIGLYFLKNSTRKISSLMEENFENHVSVETVSYNFSSHS